LVRSSNKAIHDLASHPKHLGGTTEITSSSCCAWLVRHGVDQVLEKTCASWIRDLHLANTPACLRGAEFVELGAGLREIAVQNLVPKLATQTKLGRLRFRKVVREEKHDLLLYFFEFLVDVRLQFGDFVGQETHPQLKHGTLACCDPVLVDEHFAR
jgi:hypothetical protein